MTTKLPLTLEQIIHTIAGECRNGCTNAQYTFEYFNRHHEGQVDLWTLRAIVRMINFSGLREVDEDIFKFTKSDKCSD